MYLALATYGAIHNVCRQCPLPLGARGWRLGTRLQKSITHSSKCWWPERRHFAYGHLGRALVGIWPRRDLGTCGARDDAGTQPAPSAEVRPHVAIHGRGNCPAPIGRSLGEVAGAIASFVLAGGACYLLGTAFFVDGRPRLSPGVFPTTVSFTLLWSSPVRCLPSGVEDRLGGQWFERGQGLTKGDRRIGRIEKCQEEVGGGLSTRRCRRSEPQ